MSDTRQHAARRPGRAPIPAMAGAMILAAAVGLLNAAPARAAVAGGSSAADWAAPVLLIVCGLMAGILLMTAAAAIFRVLGISDSTQAMALPEGSVRAVIAVSLVVLFAILAVLFHAKITDGSTGADEFAKQVMTVTGTLLTSVASFYFGAKTATSAATAATDQVAKATSQSSGGSAPNPASIKPVTYSAAAPSPATLTILGQNLNAVVNAQLSRSGSDPVPLTNLASNATQVTGQLAVTADMAGAPWDVVIDDGAGATSRLPAAFTIT